MSQMGHLRPSRRIAADSRSASDSGKTRQLGGVRQTAYPQIAAASTNCRRRMEWATSGPSRRKRKIGAAPAFSVTVSECNMIIIYAKYNMVITLCWTAAS
jgi:hypothetical protein